MSPIYWSSPLCLVIGTFQADSAGATTSTGCVTLTTGSTPLILQAAHQSQTGRRPSIPFNLSLDRLHCHLTGLRFGSENITLNGLLRTTLAKIHLSVIPGICTNFIFPHYIALDTQVMFSVGNCL
ncbi:hypothetical protein EDB19DRAFT_1268129 [Suillus lakei]|nr:hypothetical protein EDB19DRAFT_1268129 [Suillus lakei]